MRKCCREGEFVEHAVDKVSVFKEFCLTEYCNEEMHGQPNSIFR